MDDFECHGLAAGVWRGILRRSQPPGRLLLTHQQATLAEVSVNPAGQDLWQIAVPLPADRLGDGMQTFLLVEEIASAKPGGRPALRTLAQMTLLAGTALDHDLRAEIALMRAELDLLKREFRRLAGDQPSAGRGDQ
ncbi:MULTISPECIES: hypothetical protein [unclassified Paracoccus (in: a-proteobacteria)]|uniref:hypothetical protein n=1 Tax=unclassified Paracoccus (in: a-proteobacteria) TaxID=2688777 RepID=UPI0012B30231|nr:MULTISPECIES: hypothetical protein [unclassified Paracoccus (in: a-proteobacteria)]UXU73768.1 hypothetical protein GB879_007400 [Paracoccus sp. SMMA_5]UXU79658.1 hypothetical protein GB880_007390 [Paracoccus sp. SMMA_5_TC]